MVRMVVLQILVHVQQRHRRGRCDERRGDNEREEATHGAECTTSHLTRPGISGSPFANFCASAIESRGCSILMTGAEARGGRRSIEFAMGEQTIRPATLEDLEALTEIYNHYIVHSAITFDLQPFTAAERRGWFDDHMDSGPHRLLVATDGHGTCVGYSSSSRWRPKAAYNTTVEVSVYCRPDARGRGLGTALYRALFDTLQREAVHTMVAGVSLPNPASVSLHERLGFRPVGVFHAVGRKFDRFWDVAWFERRLLPEAPPSEQRPRTS